MEVRQTVGPDPHRIAAAMRAGGRQVPGALRRGFQRSLRPLDAAVKRQATARFPARYAAVFNASVQVKISVRTSGNAAHADVRVYADGRSKRRRVKDLEAGMLTHPIWGWYRLRRWSASRPRRRLRAPQRIKNPWSTQRIQAGFVAAALDEVRPEVTRAMRDVLDEIEQTIKGA